MVRKLLIIITTFLLILILFCNLQPTVTPIISIQQSQEFPKGTPLPSSNFIVTAYYHDPNYLKIFHKVHTGIDIILPKEWYLKHNTNEVQLHSTISGTSILSEDNCGGKSVIVVNNLFLIYIGHVSKFLVKNYEYVRQGENVAIMGNSGLGGICTTGIHVHYEIHKFNGYNYQDTINPL